MSAPNHFIVETLANQFFRIADRVAPPATRITVELPAPDHVWRGVQVRRVKGAWVPKAKAREILVRKVGCRLVEAA